MNEGTKLIQDILNTHGKQYKTKKNWKKGIFNIKDIERARI